jgi:hypothetical protein
MAGEDAKFPIFISHRTMVASKPKASVFAFEHSIAVIGGQTVLLGECGHQVMTDPCQSSTFTEDVKTSISRFESHHGEVGGQPFFYSQSRELCILESVQPAGRSHPQASLLILV